MFSRGYRMARRIVRNLAGYPLVANANKVDESHYSKRALLVYLTKPFLIREDDPLFLRHQSFRQSRNIAAVLDELGYIVDVADHLDVGFQSRRKYELLISHRIGLGRLEQALHGNTRKVYLASAMSHHRHNAIMREAYARVAHRRGCELQLPPPHPEDVEFVRMADAIVGFGNRDTVGTWAEVSDCPIYPFNNYGWPSTPSSIPSKDFAYARRSFVFFATGPVIRKGLDLLLEVFPKFPDLHLYVCCPFALEPDFCACYQKELFETPNVHPLGWVVVNSGQFIDLMERSAFVIHPALEEGQPGSVVQCMYAGLVPLVSRESGIDVEEFGFTFADVTIAEIEKTVRMVSNFSAESLRELSLKTRLACEEKFSEASFIARWKTMMNEICEPGQR